MSQNSPPKKKSKHHFETKIQFFGPVNWTKSSFLDEQTSFLSGQMESYFTNLPKGIFPSLDLPTSSQLPLDLRWENHLYQPHDFPAIRGIPLTITTIWGFLVVWGRELIWPDLCCWWHTSETYATLKIGRANLPQELGVQNEESCMLKLWWFHT